MKEILMLLRTSKLCMLTTGLVLGAVIQCGCENTIPVTGSPDQPGKVVLNPKQGDIIEWTGVVPSFLGPLPCSGGISNGQCKITVPDGSYLYQCTGCIDPEVVVGPQSGYHFRAVLAATRLSATDPVSMWCNSNQVNLAPNPATFTAHAGDSLEVVWIYTGTGNQKIPDPVVTPSQSNPVPCSESSIGLPPDNHCTFTAPTASTTYNYTGASKGGSCATSAAGTIAVTIQ
jgi:hypothetical protein